MQQITNNNNIAASAKFLGELDSNIHGQPTLMHMPLLQVTAGKLLKVDLGMQAMFDQSTWA